MCRKWVLLMALLLTVGPTGNALALIVISGTETWGATSLTDDVQVVDGGTLTVTGIFSIVNGHTLTVEEGGEVIVNPRVNFDTGGTLVMNGGNVNFNDTVKFPDSDNGAVYIYLYGGILICGDTESFAIRGSELHVGAGIMRTGDISLPRRDPESADWNIQPIPPYDTIVITDLGGDVKEISTAPLTPKIEFSSAASGALESVSPATLTVNLVNPAEGITYTVQYAVSGGTATAGVDYTLTAGTLTFEPGETTETISITIVNDGLDENDETIVVGLSNPTGNGVTLGAITEHTYTIADPRPGVEFDTDSSFGAEDVTPVIVGVSLSASLGEVVTVAYAVTGGTATGGGVDYTLEAGTLTFNPGETNKVISITVVDDELEEEIETIELTLSNQSSNVKLGGKQQHIYTIISDELGGPVYINSLGMQFIRIEPGNFMMGSDSGEWDEKPVHHVTISQRFYIQAEEVTADEYRNFDPTYSGSGYATGVSWYEAAAFADWLSLQEGLPYRLPTEAEWEYVCKNPGSVTNMQSSPREWVRDWHGEYPYNNQVDPVGPEQGFARVVRGGGLDNDDPYYRRPTNRAGIGPEFAGRQHPIGIRLMLGGLPVTAPRPYEAPFARQGIKLNTAQVLQGPDPCEPYYNQRPMLPIPPDNSSRDEIDRVGLHPSFRGHNHSPGMEVCPNGDVLMIIYTSYSEYEEGVSLMATRLRFGSDWWDMPTPMFDFPGTNDHAPMLWNDNGTLHFFWGCPRLDGNPYPFQWTSSDDSGATWDEVKFPVFEGPIGGHSKQPINTALRDSNDVMYVSSDGSGGESVLWASDNNGVTWYDPGGRTYGRHTTFVLLEDGNSILGMGGKNTDYMGTGYMPKSISTTGGQTWVESGTPFSTLDGNQRPCIIRLASGRLFFCSDFQRQDDCYQPPGITQKGALAALSDDDGQNWHIKKIPTALLHESWACDGATLGYSVARQAPNGIIHVITSMNHPCQHFEMNEKWILTGAGGDLPPDPGETGTVNQYQENYPGGPTKVTWGAKTCDDGRYLLHNKETWYYESGQKQYEVTYYNGRKVGAETYWGPDGIMQLSWDHNEANDTSVWVQQWPNGLKRVESSWRYGGKLAHGDTYHWDWDGAAVAAWNFVDGELAGSAPLPDPQIKDADFSGDYFVDYTDFKVFVSHWLENNFYPLPVGQLVAWWEFDEGSGTVANDSIGDSNGTLNGDPNWTTGYVGSHALDFDGDGDYVRTDYEDGPSEYTIALWYNLNEDINTSTFGGFRALASKTADETPSVDCWSIWWCTTYGLGLSNEVSASNYASVAYKPAMFYKNEWHHVAVTGSATQGKIYFDGDLKNTSNDDFVTGAWDDSVPFDIARPYYGTADRFFNGKVDDVRIYDYELNAEEVMQVYEGLPLEDRFVCAVNPVGDLNGDCEVTLGDFANFALHWLEGLP